MTSPIEAAILDLVGARGLDAEGWRRILPQVRATAVGLARAGKIAIFRHGKPVDPNAFKGVYRLGLPPEG
jgi:hypothetical protein